MSYDFANDFRSRPSRRTTKFQLTIASTWIVLRTRNSAIFRATPLGANVATQEFRLLSPSDSAFRYTVGLFYGDNDLSRRFRRGPLFSLANWYATRGLDGQGGVRPGGLRSSCRRPPRRSVRAIRTKRSITRSTTFRTRPRSRAHRPTRPRPIASACGMNSPTTSWCSSRMPPVTKVRRTISRRASTRAARRRDRWIRRRPSRTRSVSRAACSIEAWCSTSPRSMWTTRTSNNRASSSSAARRTIGLPTWAR